jgi:hypothetical protein
MKTDKLLPLMVANQIITAMSDKREWEIVMKNYEPTLLGTMNELKAEGYTEDFNIIKDCMHCCGGQLKIYPSDFQIDQYFRLEGESDLSL